MEHIIYQNQELNNLVHELMSEISELKLRLKELEEQKVKNPVYSEFLILLSENRNLKDDLNREILEKNSIQHKFDILIDSTKYLSMEITALQEKITAFPKDYHDMNQIIDELKKDNLVLNHKFQNDILIMEQKMYSLDFLDDFVTINSSKMCGLEKIYLSDIFNKFLLKFKILLDTEMGQNWANSITMTKINWVNNEIIEPVVELVKSKFNDEQSCVSLEKSSCTFSLSTFQIYFIYRLFHFITNPLNIV
jgi:FtsZ-binding cell division protein ZapB